MNYQALLDKYYPEKEDGAPQSSDLRRLLLKHSRQVADRCLLIARNHPELGLDEQFLEEAAMLHDIGVRWCHAPGIFCNGEEHYIRHGLIGGRILREEGYPKHARVSERHTGTGITKEQIERQSLPLPLADYIPETLEEQVVCYADKFYSKSHPDRVMTVEQTAQSLAKFGQEGVDKFLHWALLFKSILFLLLLLPAQAVAQSYSDFTFSHLGYTEGLCSERIYSVCQTKDGALWWSNKENIERYNGAVIRHFTLGGQNRYSDSAGRILKLTQRPDDTLMAFDNKGGIFEYQLATDSFIPVADVAKLVGRGVMLNDMTATANGLWLAMREGAYFFQNGTLTPVVEGTYVSTIVKGSGQLLICTRDGVLEYIDNSQSAPQRGLPLRKVLTDHVECGFTTTMKAPCGWAVSKAVCT